MRRRVPRPSRSIQEEPHYADEEPDPSRYDDALYGQIDNGAQPYPHDPAYAGRRLRLSGRL